MGVLFLPTLMELTEVWWREEDYSHGFLVIPLALFLVFLRREKLRKTSLDPSICGLGVFVSGAAFYVVGYIVRFHTLTYLCVIVTLVGVLAYLSGWKIVRVLAGPVLLLLFMIPIPSSYYVMLTNPLKLFVTKRSAEVLELIGSPVYREGNLISLPGIQMEVTEACSGVRSLYAYVMLGFVFAMMSRGGIVRKSVILSFAIGLAIGVNILRIVGMGVLSNFVGAGVGREFFHTFSGTVLFFIGFILLYVIYFIVDRHQERRVE